jgi:hypothetical protein
MINPTSASPMHPTHFILSESPHHDSPLLTASSTHGAFRS